MHKFLYELHLLPSLLKNKDEYLCPGRILSRTSILELHDIRHISNSNVYLVFLGKLLANSAKIYDDANSINMTYGDSKILAPFVPGRISIGKYTLEVLPLHAKPHQTLTNTIYNNIVHRKLGHPLKNIL